LGSGVGASNLETTDQTTALPCAHQDLAEQETTPTLPAIFRIDSQTRQVQLCARRIDVSQGVPGEIVTVPQADIQRPLIMGQQLKILYPPRL